RQPVGRVGVAGAVAGYGAASASSAPRPVRARTRSSSYISSEAGSRDSMVPSQAAANPSGIETMPGFSSGNSGSDPVKIRPLGPITLGPTSTSSSEPTSPTRMPTTAPLV